MNASADTTCPTCGESRFWTPDGWCREGTPSEHMANVAGGEPACADNFHPARAPSAEIGGPAAEIDDASDHEGATTEVAGG